MITRETKPSILVSYAFARQWEPHHARTDCFREIVLDSGAYSVANSGGVVDLDAFAEWAARMKAANPLVTEIFTLDVIGGSWRDSLKNTETLRARGLDVVPVFHVGEPTDVLRALVRDYPKVALGGAVGYRAKVKWATACFREAFDQAGGAYKLHGLGFGSATTMRLPFHTIDHANTTLRPTAFGLFDSLGGAKLPTRNTPRLNLRSEVDHELDDEWRARRLWDGKFPALGLFPSIRLATMCDRKHLSALSRGLIPYKGADQ